jgi:septum formation protein
MTDQPPLPLLLASQSERRRQLLEDAGYQFTVAPPDDSAECGICSRETPPELVARLARQKAQNVAKRVNVGIVIGCDTVAECCGQILGKPTDRTDARKMLSLMSGREHRVFSGLCLWRRPDDESLIDVAVTKLLMAELDEETLERYLDSDLWLGKAGAFGFQDGLDWVQIKEGSASNVVGLPMELFEKMLALQS